MTKDELRTLATMWTDVLEAFAQQRMREMGVPAELMGLPDAKEVRRCFNPNEFKGGGVNTLGMEVDAGVLNPDLLKDWRTGIPLVSWREARLRHRIEAVIAHEWTEFRFLTLQSAHDLALQFAPQQTGLSPETVAILEEMRVVLRGD